MNKDKQTIAEQFTEMRDEFAKAVAKNWGAFVSFGFAMIAVGFGIAGFFRTSVWLLLCASVFTALSVIFDGVGKKLK